MSLELFIALRYLLARRRQAFISVISLISTLGVAVGVMALVIALALMTGLHTELRDRILGSTAHIFVWRLGGVVDYHADVERIRQVNGVLGAAPSLTIQGIISTDDGAQAFIEIKGVDPALEPAVTDIGKAMQVGSLADVEGESPEGAPGVVLGNIMAKTLNVQKGDRVRLLTAQSSTMSPMGPIPRARTARVVGVYSLGLQEFDSGYGFVSLDFARVLAGGSQPAQIQVKLQNADDAPEIARNISATLGPEYVSQEWQQVNKPLFSALWLEKTGLAIAIGLIVTVAALNIVASLILLVMEKSRDIAILKTMGLSAPRVMKVFMLQGLIIGLVGTGVGAGLGLAACRILDKYQLIHISMDVYQIAHLPFIVRPLDFFLVIVSAVVVCFLATLYPSRQAARLDPVQALRFE
ncbi:MAG TPA: ABC transporter permease [Vicinamibacterales bacterium]|nr:ABC transporter permease [Vicinamibacterales bacterium]